MISMPRLPWPSSCPPTLTSAGMRIPSSQQSRSCQGFMKILFMHKSSFMMRIIVIFRRLPFQSLLSSIRQLQFVGKGWQRIHWTGETTWATRVILTIFVLAEIETNCLVLYLYLTYFIAMNLQVQYLGIRLSNLFVPISAYFRL